MIGLVGIFSDLRSRPSGTWSGCSGSGAGSGNPPSIQSSVIDADIVSFQVAGGNLRWRVAALIHSALYSVLNAVLYSVLP